MDTKTLLIGAAGGAVVGGGVVGVGWYFSRRALKRENEQLRATLDGLGIPQAATAAPAPVAPQPVAPAAPVAPAQPQPQQRPVTIVTAQPVELTAEEEAEFNASIAQAQANANQAAKRSHQKKAPQAATAQATA